MKLRASRPLWEDLCFPTGRWHGRYMSSFTGSDEDYIYWSIIDPFKRLTARVDKESKPTCEHVSVTVSKEPETGAVCWPMTSQG